jgi:hypothetical protein
MLVLPALADHMQWESASAASNVWQGFYTSPYLAWDRSMNPQPDGQLITLYCLDYNHEVAPPYVWDASINPLSLAGVSLYQYGSAFPTAQAAYLQYVSAAWIFTAMRGLESGQPAGWRAIETEYQAAAWKLFVDGAHAADLNARIHASGAAFETAVDLFYNQALAAAAAWVPDGTWYVVTSDAAWVDANQPGRPVQEFLTYQPNPEPGTWLLMAAVFAATGIRTWRKRRA